MAEVLDEEIEGYEDAVYAVLQRINLRVDPRKILWASYPSLGLDRNELEEKVDKDTNKIRKELDDEDIFPMKLWFVGIPRFKLIRRGIAHLSCEIDLYYVASYIVNIVNNDWTLSWYGKLIPKADKFEVPLSLIRPLVEALSKEELETDSAKVIERGLGYSVYEYLGREWKIPDAFLGFLLALKDKNMGFEDLLDPVSCALLDKFIRELPAPESPKLPPSDYEELTNALRSLGWEKAQAERRAREVMEKYPNLSIEEKIKHALSG